MMSPWYLTNDYPDQKLQALQETHIEQIMKEQAEVPILTCRPPNERPVKQEYKYRSLEDSNMIRLLELYPGAVSDPLRGNIRHARLNDVVMGRDQRITKHSFEALSYVWGAASYASQIECVEGI